MKRSEEEKERARAWFKDTFGFVEQGFTETRGHFELQAGGTLLVSKDTGAQFAIGEFELPSLEELRSRLKAVPEDNPAGGLSFRQVVGEAVAMHQDSRNAGGVFQVASQFNCLEMLFPDIRPEDGVTRYAEDRTQGPACALVCPGATIFRNYFVNGCGQAGGKQLDTLKDVGVVLGNRWQGYWRMQNGYCLPGGSTGCLRLQRKAGPALWALGKHLRAGGPDLAEQIRSKLRVGVHWETAVRGCDHKVCQVFCSAVPMTFVSTLQHRDLAPLARVVLEAAYEAVLATAALMAQSRQQRIPVFLTALGGGSFGNDEFWILGAVERAMALYRTHPLDVELVYFRNLPSGPLKDLQLPGEGKQPWLEPSRLFQSYYQESRRIPRYRTVPQASGVLKNFPLSAFDRSSIEAVLVCAVEHLQPEALEAAAAFLTGLAHLGKVERSSIAAAIESMSNDQELQLDNPGVRDKLEEVRLAIERRAKEPETDDEGPPSECCGVLPGRKTAKPSPANLPRELARLT